MAITSYNGCTWYPIKSGNSCPVCGYKNGRCSVFIDNNTDKIVMYRCKYRQSDKPSQGWYIHLNLDSNGTNTQKSVSVTNLIADTKSQISDSKEYRLLKNAVYLKIRDLMYKYIKSYLYKEHIHDLIRRGLNEDEILNMKLFSYPRNSQKVNYNGKKINLTTAIVNDLLKCFEPNDLLKVPGFKVIEKNNKKYIILKSLTKKDNKFIDINAYFIPYINNENLITGMQYRLIESLIIKGKSIRYLWLSSDVSCGSPIDYYIPTKITRDDILLITEGSLKGKISSEKLGIRSLTEAGVSNYNNLIRELQKIEKRENKKFKIILAFDMDKYSIDEVITAEIKTAAMLKSLGYSVSVLEWNINDGKGLDDKLQSTGLKHFRCYKL